MKIARLAATLVAAAALVPLASGGAVSAEKKLTILTWNQPQNEDLFRQWIADFESQHPGVKVDWLDKKGTEWPAFYQTQVVAGTPPDVINIQAMLWVEYAAKGFIMDLAPLLAKEKETLARYNPDLLKYWQTGGGQYALPFLINKSILYYNKLLLKKAGLDGPPKTFDELLSYSEKIAATAPENTGFLTLNFDWLYWSLFAANGVEFEKDGKAVFNTPATLALVKRLAKATADGAISKVSWTGRWRENNDAFASGTVGMYNAHGGAYYNFKSGAKWLNKDTIGVAPFPGGWGTLLPHGWAVSKGTKHPELAWELTKLITGDKWAPKNALRYIRTTGNKSADAILDDHLSKEDPVGKQVMAVQAAHLDKVTGIKATPLEPALNEAFWPDIQSAMLGQKDPKAALDDAENKVNRVFRRGR